MTHDELLVTVATWYYEEQLGQSEIAQRLNKSRSMVSRLLQEAREIGIVEIRIRWPLQRDEVLEEKLCRQFGLQEAWVSSFTSENYSSLLSGLGSLGALCVKHLLRRGMSVSVGWGKTLYEVVRFLPEIDVNDGRIIQIIGSLGHGDPLIEGTELVRWLAQKTGSQFKYLPSPLFVENEQTAKSLLEVDAIAQTLTLGRHADLALIGIGALESPASTLYHAGYFDDKDIEFLKACGSVGSILGNQIDQFGHVLDIFANKRIIGLKPDELKGINTVVAFAGGMEKVLPILGSLRGGYLDVLVTDSATAESVLKSVET